jgi:putative flavoprotein involved in K+ transport
VSTPAIVIGAGQVGIAAALALQGEGFRPLELESGTDTAGSWPHYYDSPRLFTPAGSIPCPDGRFPVHPIGIRHATRWRIPARLRGGHHREVHTGHRVTARRRPPRRRLPGTYRYRRGFR